MGNGNVTQTKENPNLETEQLMFVDLSHTVPDESTPNPNAVLPDVPGVYKIDFTFQIGTNTGAHSHLYVATSASNAPTSDLSAFASFIATSWGTDMVAQCHSSVTLTFVQVFDLGHGGKLPGTWAGTKQGTGSGSLPPADMCMLVNMTVGRRYKGGHPRLYLPCLTPGQLQTNNTWSSSTLAGATTALTAFINHVIGYSGAAGPITGVVSVSYRTGGALRPTPIVDNVSGLTVNPIPGSQRRRLQR